MNLMLRRDQLDEEGILLSRAVQRRKDPPMGDRVLRIQIRDQQLIKRENQKGHLSKTLIS